MSVEPARCRVVPKLFINLLLLAALLCPGVGCTALDLAGDDGADFLSFEDPEVKAFVEQQEAARRAALVSRKYDLAELLAAARATFEHDEEAAKEELACVLFQYPHGVSPDRVERLVWSGTTAEVLASPERHARIATGIQALREQGFAGVVTLEIRTEVVTPDKNIESLFGGWTVGDVNMSRVEESAPSADGLRANRVTERLDPVRYKVLDDRTAMKVLQFIQGDRRISRLPTPKITTCNGQSITISDCRDRPYVVAIENGRRKFRMVRQGMGMSLRPLRLDDGRIRLECEVTFSDISWVDTTTFDAQGKKADNATPESGTTIRIPEVNKLVVSGSIEMRPDQSLLIDGLRRFRGPDRSPETHMLLITPRMPFADETAKQR